MWTSRPSHIFGRLLTVGPLNTSHHLLIRDPVIEHWRPPWIIAEYDPLTHGVPFYFGDAARLEWFILCIDHHVDATCISKLLYSVRSRWSQLWCCLICDYDLSYTIWVNLTQNETEWLFTRFPTIRLINLIRYWSWMKWVVIYWAYGCIDGSILFHL